jgi:hypothetical protein
VAAALVGLACDRDQPPQFAPAPGTPVWAETIHRPAKLSSVEAGIPDPAGRPARLGCATCHALRPSRPLPASAADLREFHAGLVFAHGELRCTSCHVEGRHDLVHLSDGTRLPLTEVVRLCGQCHGPQHRDYRHGAHGGMNGYWDLSRGPRLRNSCVDCHDPHSPRWSSVRPALPPQDRFPPPAEAEKDPAHE